MRKTKRARATTWPALAPDAGDKLGRLQWKAVALDSSWLNFWPLYDKAAPEPGGHVAYAHAWLHSAEGTPVFLDTMFSSTARVWLNGQDLGPARANGSRRKLALEKGWNRLLLRVAPLTDTGWTKGVVQWHFNAALFGAERDEYESQNIRWTTPLPDNGPGAGSPILVGDRLFLTAESSLLVCISARDGTVLWVRSSTYADAASPEERTKNPAVFAEADKLAADVAGALAAYCDGPAKYAGDDKARRQRIKDERAINKLLVGLNADKYCGQTESEGGQAAGTPVSDGRCVYALFGSGVVACFDLEGHRKWTSALDVRHAEHGYCASPCLIDGRVVVKASGCVGAVALDCRTGAAGPPMRLWKTAGLHMISTPLPLTVAGEPLVVQSFGLITRVKDGKTLAKRSRRRITTSPTSSLRPAKAARFAVGFIRASRAASGSRFRRCPTRSPTRW